MEHDALAECKVTASLRPAKIRKNIDKFVTLSHLPKLVATEAIISSLDNSFALNGRHMPTVRRPEKIVRHFVCLGSYNLQFTFYAPSFQKKSAAEGKKRRNNMGSWSEATVIKSLAGSMKVREEEDQQW